MDNETIVAVIINGTTNDVQITWEEPNDPNGLILGYRIRLENQFKNTVLFVRWVIKCTECFRLVSTSVSIGLNIMQVATDGYILVYLMGLIRSITRLAVFQAEI